jgi:hypothetical protein
VAQTVLLSPVHRCANCIGTIIGTTTLYSNCEVKERPPSPGGFCAKSSILWGYACTGQANYSLERLYVQSIPFIGLTICDLDDQPAEGTSGSRNCQAWGLDDEEGLASL